jgi:phosphoribosylamine--glycine ligase
MGAYAPVPRFTPALHNEVMDTIARPALAALAGHGTPFRGALYVGMMLTADGPKVIEFNARFGDPECQVLMVLLKSDIVPALMAAHAGGLDRITLDWHEGAAMTVVMATRGYPGAYEKGSVIRGLDAAGALPGVTLFHAGTAGKDGNVIANGGRVLNVTARGATLAEARERAYAATRAIDWPQGFYRSDIGARALFV